MLEERKKCRKSLEDVKQYYWFYVGEGDQSRIKILLFCYCGMVINDQIRYAAF